MLNFYIIKSKMLNKKCKKKKNQDNFYVHKLKSNSFKIFLSHYNKCPLF